MIPKIIHYVWIGGNPLPEYVKNNIETWKKYNPNYEIKEWNESNFDINVCKYAVEAYNAKKWGFVGDIIRLYALYNFGGIYLDVDVECVKSFDSLLDNHAVLGFEGKYHFSNAILMSEKNNLLFKYFIDQYNNRSFKSDDKYLWGCAVDLTSAPAIMTTAFMKFFNIHFIKNGSYKFSNVTVYPQDYLSPNVFDCPDDHYKSITNNTITIHHFEGSWKAKHPLMLTKLQKLIINIRFVIAFKMTKILGNKKFLKLEQSTYELTHRYDKINREKKKKNVSAW